MKIFIGVICAAAIGSSLAVISGCGAGPQPYDQAAVKEGVANATAMRSAYDKAGGDLSKVPAEVLADLEKRYGGSERVKVVWQSITDKTSGSTNDPTAR